MDENFIKLIVSIIIFAGVLALTYYTTRFVGKLHKSHLNGTNISVIETQNLSANKGVYIIKIGQEYYALATGKDTVSVIGKLDSSGLILPEENPETGNTTFVGEKSFERILEKFKNKKQDKE